MKYVSLVVGLGLLALGCSGSGSDSDDDARPKAPRSHPQAFAAAARDFYVVPTLLPKGKHGDLLRYQPIGGAPDGVTWYRVMYLSRTVRGEPTVVTGVVTVPTGQPPREGWPLVSHAHGSTGIADACAPSVSLGGDRTSAPEIVLLSATSRTRGVVIASTDYEGLGGPGRHPFLVGVSEGRSVLDVALAARQIPGVKVGPRTALAGYSQGGHAILWANQIARDWAPSLHIAGTMAGAPASEVPTLASTLPAQLRGQFEVTLVGAYAAAYPQADPAKILTPAGRDLLKELDTVCVPVQEPDPATPLVRDPTATTEPWAGLLRDNVPGTLPGASPVLIIHSAQDHNVPIADSARLLARLRQAGQAAERRVLPTGDHVTSAVPAYEQAFEWFDELWKGAK